MSSKTTKTILTSLILQRNPLLIPRLSQFEHDFMRYQSEYVRKISKGELSFNGKGNFIPANSCCIDYISMDVISNDDDIDKPTPPTTTTTARRRSIISNDDYIDEPTTTTTKPANTKDLNREMYKKLYLVVKEDKNGNWKFPTAKAPPPSPTPPTEGRKGLHHLAREILPEEYEIYQVGAAPVAVFACPDTDERTFFFRSQLIIPPTLFGITKLAAFSDYAFLTKTELKECFGDSLYYSSIKDVIS